VAVAAGLTVLRGLAVGLGVAGSAGTGDGLSTAGAGVSTASASPVGSGVVAGSGAGGLQAPRTITLKTTAISSGAIRILVKVSSNLIKLSSPANAQEFSG
jgi:hypothetical protein